MLGMGPDGYALMRRNDKAKERRDLRDQFAMAALTGLLSCEETSGDPDVFAEWSYEYADALLAAREAK